MRSKVQVFPGPPFTRHDDERGCSSAGRARDLHSRGHRFDPVHLHHSSVDIKSQKFKRELQFPLRANGEAIDSCRSWLLNIVENMKTDTVVRLKPSFMDVGYLITAKDNLHMLLGMCAKDYLQATS